MIVHDIPQNEEAWFEFRKGKSSGSRGQKLMPSPRMTKAMSDLEPEELGRYKASLPKKDEFYRLVAEEVARPITPNDYEDRLNGQKYSMMARGHILEPEAIKAFEAHTGLKTLERSVVWQRDGCERSILSPDAEIESDTEAVEVKCPDSHVIIRAWDEQEYPSEYKWQVVKYFVTNEKLQKLHFVLYTDVMPSLPILIFEIKREDILKEIIEYTAFEDSILRQASELVERLSF